MVMQWVRAILRDRVWRLTLRLFALCMSWPGVGWADLVDEAHRVVESAAGRPPWAGPRTGPAAVPGKSVVVLAEDLRNGGVLGVAQGIREAARAIGWQVRVVDAGGTPAGRQRAVAEALATTPDGLVICGSDADELEPLLREASPRLPPIVGWHAGPRPGPIAGTSVAMNVSAHTTPVEVSLNPVATGDGHLLVLVARDATLRKEAERHLIAARDAAEAAREAQATFLTTLSHELRTPLNGILGFAQVLRRHEPLTERQARGLGVIEDCGQHLLMLIDDLLDLARMDKAGSSCSRPMSGCRRSCSRCATPCGSRRRKRAWPSPTSPRRGFRPPCSSMESACARCFSTCCPTRSSSAMPAR